MPLNAKECKRFIKIASLFFFWASIVAAAPVGAYCSTSDTILIPFTNRHIVIDGSLNEWGKCYRAKFSDTCSMVHTAGKYKLSQVYPPNFSEEKIPVPLSKNKVVAMLCWDYEAIYLGMQVFDKHLAAEFSGMDDNPNIYLNDAVEFYIDTKNDSKERMDVNDYQFIVDILNQNVIFKGNLRQMNSDTCAVPKERGQNILIYSSISLFGGVNNVTSDSFFVVEIKIPFAAIGMVPKEGTTIKIDVCNDDADRLIADLNILPDELYLTWPFNWIGIGDFGYPSKWQPAILEGTPSLYYKISDKHNLKWVIALIVFILVASIIVLPIIRKTKGIGNVSLPELTGRKVLLVNSLNGSTVQTSNEQILLKASEYVSKNSSSQINVNELADFLNISLRTLQRITCEELNTTPTAFFTSIKLQLSKDHLIQKGNVSEVAYQFGFSDPAYYSKLFKKEFGISPREFISISKRPEN